MAEPSEGRKSLRKVTSAISTFTIVYAEHLAIMPHLAPDSLNFTSSDVAHLPDVGHLAPDSHPERSEGSTIS